MPDFAFYSTDIDPTVDPANASPAPATLVVLDQPPIFGEYDFEAGSVGRGSVHPTLGGQVVQDFGVFDVDGRITFSDTDALSSDTVDDLQALWQPVAGEYYFTDGYNIWKVRFPRPDGFKARRNLLFSHHGQDVFSYEIALIVVAKIVTYTQDCGLSLEVVAA
jgi:hypothetical protein